MSPPSPSAPLFAAPIEVTGIWAVVVAAVMVLAIGFGFYYEHQRKKKLQAFAAARRLTYAARDDSWVRLDTGYPHGQGRAHRAKHVMTGQHRGRPIVIFEHEWKTGSGKDTQTHQVRKTLMGLPKSFPKLELRPEGIFGRAARRMGMKDIELESDDFNQRYKVSGDRRFAYDVLHPRFMQWMLGTSAPGFTINGQYVALYGQGKIDTSKVDQEVAYLDAIVEHLPGYVVG
jgi:hypothetical protein